MRIRELTKYRNSWMGIAILWIILYHSGLSIGFAPLEFLKSSGYGGVDIFFFASGLGCYFSLHNNPDSLCFLKRRFFRLAPTYFPFIILWLISQALLSEISFQSVIGNILFIQDLTGLGQAFNWYISALIIFYLLAPYLKMIADRSGRKGIVLLMAVFLLLSISFWKAETYIISVTRIPIFFIGMLVGKLCMDEQRMMSRRQIVGLIIAMLFGGMLLLTSAMFFKKYMWSHGLYWYPFILITPGLCLCISYMVHWIEKIRWLAWGKTMLEIIGKNSFELYLLHSPAAKLLSVIIREYELARYGNWLWIGFFVVLPPMCFLFKRYVCAVSKLAKSISTFANAKRQH